MNWKKKLARTYLYSIYKWCRYGRWQPKEISQINVLESFFDLNKTGTLIQIGAYDGITVDPLFPFIKEGAWNALLVEPQKSAFRKLEIRYASFQNVMLENAAIYSENGKKNIYKPAGVDDSVLASFSDKHVKKHFINETLLTKELVNTIRFDSLVEKYNIHSINILVIDTEGYDFEILKQINFSRYNINILIYEYEHLSHKDYKKSLRILKNNGFKVYKDSLDIIAINNMLKLSK